MASATKNVTTTLRIAPEEHAAWAAAAAADGRTLSSWIRRQCNSGLPEQPADKRPAPARGKRRGR